MLIRKANPGEGPVCDALLTRLIQTERQWEPNLDETFTVCDNYEHRMSEEGTLLLVAEENDEIEVTCHFCDKKYKMSASKLLKKVTKA